MLKKLSHWLGADKELKELRESNLLLWQANAGLQLTVANLEQQRKNTLQEAVRVLSAITLQHGGEYVLDQTFLDMVDENTILLVDNANPDDKTDRSTRYAVRFQEPETQSAEPEDEGRCPDCGLRSYERGCADTCQACDEEE